MDILIYCSDFGPTDHQESDDYDILLDMGQLDIDQMIRRLMDVVNIGQVTFREIDLYQFDQTFWDKVGVCLKELEHRVIGISYIMYYTLFGKPNPSFNRGSLLDIPFKSIEMALEGMPLVYLPDTIRSLHLQSSYDPMHIAPGDLTMPLEELYLYGDFSAPLLPGTLPSSLRILHIAAKFNQPLDRTNLPCSLTELCLDGSQFNQPVTDFPASIITLTLGVRYTNRIDHLPLQHLVLHSNHAIHIAMVELRYLRVLKLMSSTLIDLDAITSTYFPNLDKLCLPMITSTSDLTTLPASLRRLNVEPYIPQEPHLIYPNGITSLTIDRSYLTFDKVAAFNVQGLPSSLTRLKLVNKSYYIEPSELPPSIRELYYHRAKPEHALAIMKGLPPSIRLIQIPLAEVPAQTFIRVNDTILLRLKGGVVANECMSGGFVNIQSIIKCLEQDMVDADDNDEDTDNLLWH
ncbi:hypothetical protein SAMD00019534_073040 [Acytostelium subglobosum LB1]|uniref:hypothetical protein n=1 Tax=Acytostelium subglobosum LB1 TaxID=1410327 RepID=UPI0006447F05|nr:hypothetical protein SAMD00019534_073040 [Acytostelium subglobosum LB1]GAM24129.1 hypothetical protein SAMD00019534_073040 [Acytostelium subglobosum LB1]|eukprot:XP_012753165.1 hypothetical protein SAMD00019534_073040 [Acytostelium subglobosum LB1]